MLAASPLLSKRLLCRCPLPAVIHLLDRMQNLSSLVLETEPCSELPHCDRCYWMGVEEGPGLLVTAPESRGEMVNQFVDSPFNNDCSGSFVKPNLGEKYCSQHARKMCLRLAPNTLSKLFSIEHVFSDTCTLLTNSLVRYNISHGRVTLIFSLLILLRRLFIFVRL